MTRPELFATVVGPIDDPEACETCHGEGELQCVRGCHVIDCPDCDATGDREPSSDSPLPSREDTT